MPLRSGDSDCVGARRTERDGDACRRVGRVYVFQSYRGRTRVSAESRVPSRCTVCRLGLLVCYLVESAVSHSALSRLSLTHCTLLSRGQGGDGVRLSQYLLIVTVRGEGVRSDSTPYPCTHTCCLGTRLLTLPSTRSIGTSTQMTNMHMPHAHAAVARGPGRHANTKATSSVSQGRLFLLRRQQAEAPLADESLL